MAAILLGYGLLFVIFDTQATLFEVAPGMSLWYPSAGLNLALVMIFGAAYAPAVFAALMASGLWISEPAIPVHDLVLPNLAIAVGNGMVALVLRRALDERSLASPTSIIQVVAAMAGLAMWNAGAGSLAYLVTGLEGYTLETLSSTIFKWWIGDWAGMLTLTPPLLVVAVAGRVRSVPTAWHEGLRLRWPTSPTALLEMDGQIAAAILSLYGAFYLFEGPYLLYLCFLPVLWMALRNGLAGGAVSAMIVNLGAVLVLSGASVESSILGLQLFILALALTGLVVGAFVSERKYAVETLHSALERSEATGEAGSSAATTERDALKVANRMQSRHRQLAEDATVLERQNRRKDQIFGIIAHDLQGAVGTATGLANVVETEADSLSRDMIETFGQRLGQSLERAQGLLDNLLNWARVQLGEEPSDMDEHRIDEIVESAVADVKPDANEKGVAIECGHAPAVPVQGDGMLLQAVVRNLLSNATKFTEEGGRVVVSTKATDEAATLCIHDDGVGMPSEEVDALLEPGESVSRSGTQGKQGTGLGLVLCREIVEHHDGDLWAESSPGEGTTVCFSVPRPSDDADRSADEARRGASQR